MFLASLNSDLVKYALLAVTAPLWWPFLKALYESMNEALREEGGLTGRPPTKTELRAIQRTPLKSPSPLVNKEHGDNSVRQPRQARTARETPPRSASAPASGRSAQASGGGGFSRPRGAQGFARKDKG